MKQRSCSEPSYHSTSGAASPPSCFLWVKCSCVGLLRVDEGISQCTVRAFLRLIHISRVYSLFLDRIPLCKRWKKWKEKNGSRNPIFLLRHCALPGTKRVKCKQWWKWVFPFLVFASSKHTVKVPFLNSHSALVFSWRLLNQLNPCYCCSSRLQALSPNEEIQELPPRSSAHLSLPFPLLCPNLFSLVRILSSFHHHLGSRKSLLLDFSTLCLFSSAFAIAKSFLFGSDLPNVVLEEEEKEEKRKRKKEANPPNFDPNNQLESVWVSSTSAFKNIEPNTIQPAWIWSVQVEILL